MFQQLSKDMENLYRDIAGLVMHYDGPKNLCREVWEKEIDFLYLDRSKETIEKLNVRKEDKSTKP